MKIDATTVLALCAVLTILGAVFSYVNKANLKPINILIKSNVQAMEKIAVVLDRQACKLEDHDERLVEIETKHKLHHPEES